MPRRPGLQDLKKKFRVRFTLASVIMIVWLLADEFVKEGYFFDVSDVTMPGTHEFLIVTVIALNLVLHGLWFSKKKKKKKYEGKGMVENSGK